MWVWLCRPSDSIRLTCAAMSSFGLHTPRFSFYAYTVVIWTKIAQSRDLLNTEKRWRIRNANCHSTKCCYRYTVLNLGEAFPSFTKNKKNRHNRILVGITRYVNTQDNLSGDKGWCVHSPAEVPRWEKSTLQARISDH